LRLAVSFKYQLGFSFGEAFYIFRPVAEFLIRRANLLAGHTTNQAIMPRRLNPGRECTLPFIMKCQAFLSLNEETFRNYRGSGAHLDAGVAFITLLHVNKRKSV
jgi:hypothetical protein